MSIYKPKIEGNKEEQLKHVIRLSYKSFMWMFIFLLLGVLGKYMFHKWIGYLVETGILIATIILIRINKALEKKRLRDIDEQIAKEIVATKGMWFYLEIEEAN